MKRTSIVVSTHDWNAALVSLFTPDGFENAGVLLCGIADTESERRLLVRQFLPVPLSLYIKREAYHLEVSPRFYNDIVDVCERNKVSPVIIHSHPHSDEAWYSPSDDFGEGRLLPVLTSLLPEQFSASLVVTPLSITGRALDQGDFAGLAGLTITGQRSRIINFSRQAESQSSSLHDRQVLAFGKAGQGVLERLRIGIVGLGGTGSIVAEQLVRTGVADFVLIDYDVLELSNVSRVFGTKASGVGRKKVDVIGRQLRSLGATRVKEIAKSAIQQEVLLSLRDRDLVFCCVDNDKTRAILNRFSYQYLTPVIDLGTRFDATGGKIEAAAGRVAVAGSGLTCLRCSHYISPERILAESLSVEQRRTLAKEGYVMGIDEPVPAVVSLNTIVAGLAVTAGINMFLDLTGGEQPLAQHYDAKRGELFTATPVHELGCDICDENAGLKGIGDSEIVSSYSDSRQRRRDLP